MKKTITAVGFAVLGMTASLGLVSNALANDGSPVGTWKTVDDNTGKVRSLVRITEVNGEMTGKIEKLFREPGEDANPKCDKCTDSRKDQPIIGLVFLTGLKKDGDEYSGGQILDPDNGKLYRSKVEVVEGGKKLKVRGYIGPFFRTQMWLKSE
jgi:uncharacterized protein (DUF2147 family)